MAIDYPSALDSFTDPAGTSLLTSPDHAALHTDNNSAIEALESTVGTTQGTNVLKSFAAGDFPARIDSSGVFQQAVQGTLNASVIGTPAITGGTLDNGVFGTPAITGGTLASPVVNNSTIGTPAATGGTYSAVKTLNPLVGTLTDAAGGTIAIDASVAPLLELTFGTTAGNRTLANPSNAVDGQSLAFRIKQNTGNTGTTVWGSQYTFSSDFGDFTPGTEATWNRVNFRYQAAGTLWLYEGEVKNII